MTSVDNTLLLSRHDIEDLLAKRWNQAIEALADLLHVDITCGFGHSIHFDKPRGYAVTRIDGNHFDICLSEKLIGQPYHRTDAVIRHEIGHVIDYSSIDLPPGLPYSTERRADAIAEMIWGDVIYYDLELVQSLLPGVSPRPAEIGL